MELVQVKGISKRTKKPIVLDADQCLDTDLFAARAVSHHGSGRDLHRASRERNPGACDGAGFDFDRLTMMVKVKAVNGRIGPA